MKEYAKPEKSFWYNYLMHSIEGGLYMGGLAFIASDTVIPPLIKALNGPVYLITLMPILTTVGFYWPPLFTAHLIQKLRHLKPALMISGIFQRIPFLFAALVLFLIGSKSRLLTLAVVALAPLLSGLAGGVTLAAWQGLVAKTIPAKRLSSLWAVRFIISSFIGIFAGGVISYVLEKHPGVKGYGYLHLFTFLSLMLSYFFFSFIKEDGKEEVDREKTNMTLIQIFKMIPAIVRNDNRLKNYLMTRSLMNAFFIMTPFLSIRALEATGREESFLGLLVSAQMTGCITGNLLAGSLGDKFGPKPPMIIARFLLIAVCGWGCLANQTWMFYAIFFLYGMAYYCDRVGTATMSIVLSDNPKRTLYLSLISAVNPPTLFAASFISGLTWSLVPAFYSVSILAAVLIALSFIPLLKIRTDYSE